MNWYCLTCSDELFTVQMLREANYEGSSRISFTNRRGDAAARHNLNAGQVL